MRNPMRRLWTSLSLILLAGVALAGCSGFGSSSSTTATNNMTLNVCQATKSVAYFPNYVAQQKGFFKDQGLNIPPITISGTGAKVAAAVTAGSCQVGDGVMTDAFVMARVNSSARIIGSLVNGYYVDVTFSKKLEASTGITATSSLAAKINALKGKKIGITGPGSGTEGLLIYLFRLQGMDAQKDATLVNLGSNNSAALGALKAGTVDAVSFASPVGQAATIAGSGDIIISPDRGDIPAMEGQVHGAFYTTQNVIDSQPKAIAGYIRSMAEAESFIHNNPAEATTMLNTYLNLGSATTTAVMNAYLPVLPKDPTISQDGYNKSAQFHVKAGLIAATLPYASVVASSTISSALASK